MPVATYDVTAPVLLQGLAGLRGVLQKAQAHVAARSLDPDALLRARLYPDMFPLLRQVQIACDFAKGAAGRLAEAELPSFPDDETTFDDLLNRIDRTREFIQSLPPEAFEGAEDREVSLVRRGETKTFTGKVYLLEQALPNFWFHVTTAYAILRHNGVELGKRDFLGLS